MTTLNCISGKLSFQEFFFKNRGETPRMRISIIYSQIWLAPSWQLVCKYNMYVFWPFRGYYAANTVYLCSIIIFFCTVLIVILENTMYRRNIRLFQKSWIILTLLLHRTVNIPMMALMLLTKYFVSKVFVDSLLMITTYYWLGQASFFYQVGVCCLCNLTFCNRLPFEKFGKWLSIVYPTFIRITLDKRWTSLYFKPAYEDFRCLLCCDRFSQTTIVMQSALMTCIYM